MSKNLLVSFSILASLILTGQQYVEPSKLKTFSIIVNNDDHTIKSSMLNSKRKISTSDLNQNFMWYANHKIFETKGGYDGRLIHGEYRSFFLNGQLRAVGTVRYGLKIKKWKYWHPNGTINEIVSWKRGKKNGTYSIYDELGYLLAKGYFRNDRLHGRFKTYSRQGKVIDKKKYRNGIEIHRVIKPKKNNKTVTKYSKTCFQNGMPKYETC